MAVTDARCGRADANGYAASSVVNRRSVLTGMAALPLTGVATAHAAMPIAPIDMRPFEQWILGPFAASVKVGPGVADYAGKPGEAVDLYGVSDMAAIFYTLSRLDPTEDERRAWGRVFQSFQRDGDGLLVRRIPSHDVLHNTAYALGSMELLGVRPERPVRLPMETDPAAFLETLDWKTGVYQGSHRGAGMGAAYYLLCGPDPAWFSAYFAKCDALFDPRFGMMGRGKASGGDFDTIGGTFHYGFLYETFRRTMPYAEARIDAVIALRQPDGYWHPTNRLWLTLDALYLLTRATRVTTHRFDEVQRVVIETMRTLARDVYSADGRAKTFGDAALPTHSVMAAISIAAEAQRFLGAEVIMSERPLRLVLDRRPFI